MQTEMAQLAGKNAVVTGGASGIGAAITARFIEHGARVWVLDRDTPATLAGQPAPEQNAGAVIYLQCDVADHMAVRNALSNAPAKLDILVNNAGVSHIGNIAATTEEDFDRVYQVNVKGLYNVTHACIDRLIANGAASIVNIASVAASIGLEDRFAYSMSKGAVLAMTRSIARDYVAAGVRCNAISPARIHTPFVDDYLKKNYPGQETAMFAKLAATQPIGRMGTPEEVAAMAVFLCSTDAGFITGSDFSLDGGFTGLKI